MKFAGSLKIFTLSAFLTTCFAGNAFSAVEYTLHKSENPTEDELDAYQRITIVMDSAVKLYNTYSNLSKYINVYYAPGVPTAEASSNGDLRFGENRSYMVVPTAMHEMAHTMGVGTTSEYAATCVDGVFRNDKVQAKLREIDGPNAELHCDRQHIWPYGLNQASEAKSEQDLINHVIIVETIYQQLFKVAFFKEGRIKSLGDTKNCMGITSSNALELMDCSESATFVKIFSVGDNPVTYYVQMGSRVIDIPNESTAAGVQASTYGYNGGAHQRYIFEEAIVDTPNAFYLKNFKSGHYLQSVGNTVVQNPKGSDDDFIWQLLETSEIDTSSADTSVADTSKQDTSKTDIAAKQIMKSQQLRLPTRTFDLKGRQVREQALSRARGTILFKKKP